MAYFQRYFFLILLFAAHSYAVRGQDRNPDILITTGNQKLEVEIKRVTQDSIEFVRWNDAHKLSKTLPKTRISSILYGNGKVETFKQADNSFVDGEYTPLFDDDPKPPKPEIEELTTAELKGKYQLFTERATKYKNMAIVGSAAGGALIFLGANVVSNADGFDLGSVMVGVLLAGAGLGGGTAFTITGVLNSINYGQKRKRVRKELQRRNESLTHLRINPGYSTNSKVGYLSLRITF